MKTVDVIVGSVNAGHGGSTTGETRRVQFEGQELATTHQTESSEDERTDRTETLYRTGDGRLLVYVQDWSHWQDGAAVYSLTQVSEQDLGSTGKYAQLGQAAGFWRADGALYWGPEGPVCQRCGRPLPRSAMPSHYVAGQPVYLCHDCESSGGHSASR